MSQLVNPNRWTVYPDFANSCGPEGEKLEVWAYREWHGEAHVGETPPQLIAETREHARKAVEAIDKVTRVRKNKEEFARLKNDMYAYKAFTDCFTDKLEASMLVLRYSYSNEISDLEQAYSLMESSLDHYRKLEELTRDSYLYANSMQTGMRRIPVTGNNGANKTWTELLPQFEQELARFDANIQKTQIGQSDPGKPESTESGRSQTYFSCPGGILPASGRGKRVQRPTFQNKSPGSGTQSTQGSAYEQPPTTQ